MRLRSAGTAPSADFVFVWTPNLPLGDPTMYGNLGTMYLASVLEREGLKVAIADLRDKEVNIDLIPPAKFYGFGFTTGESRDAKRIARLLKQRDPSCITIAGGPHPSLLPDDCADHFDHIIIGEGEQVLPLIVRSRAEKFIRAARIKDLDRIPFPARHLANVFSTTLFPGERYGHGEKATTLISNRGCPYRCNYCANLHRTPVVFRSPENVAAEVQELIKRYDCRHFRDESDNIALNKPWLMKLCSLLQPLNVRWKAHSRASHLLDEDKIVALKEAGCVEMGIGVESADQRVLDAVNKQERVEDYYKAISLLKKHGIRTKVYFMAALPFETEETIKLNMEFMKKAKPDKWTLSITMIYPGCEIWKNPERFRVRIIDRDFSHYWNFPSQPVHEIEGANINTLLNRYREFYQWLRSEVWRKN